MGAPFMNDELSGVAVLVADGHADTRELRALVLEAARTSSGSWHREETVSSLESESR
jgi:hypothetical protein